MCRFAHGPLSKRQVYSGLITEVAGAVHEIARMDWVWGSGKCVLSLVTLESRTKCALCPVFCAGFCKHGSLVGFMYIS